MTTFRLVLECWQNNPHYEVTEHGTDWYWQKMDFIRSLSGILPPFEVVWDLSPSNTTFATIQTLADGKGDMEPTDYGVTWGRFQFIDFSLPYSADEDFIFAASKQKE